MDLLKERKLKRRIGRKTKMIYYISDTHFRNQDIFDKCKRPFKLLDEMESTVISKWNNKVNDVDVVWRCS